MDSSDDLQLFPMKKAAVALWVRQGAAVGRGGKGDVLCLELVHEKGVLSRLLSWLSVMCKKE